METWLQDFLKSIPDGANFVSVRQLIEALSKLPGGITATLELTQAGGDWCVIVNLSKFNR